ncbi:uncharacterized protein LOC124459852 [Drosophila willistoni]|uniref:uncharacterized protein LOC124459852 n=1 Tax=Drosophila willistoni TaxID=7260 RepID=UPI001F072A81|nr:uncharacterized protein LOC124459852 [Drosophila willistoni]
MYKILIECLWKTGKVKECLIYSESFLHFSMQSYFHELNGLWIDSISFSLSYIEYIITTQGNEMVDALKGNLSRLVQDIINILSCLLDEDVEKKTKTSDEIKVRSSWTILYNILLREDQINHNLIDIPDEEARLPASFRLLFTAHQYMGRSQSCTLDNGEFLQFILRSIIPELHAPMYDSCRNHVLEYIEQVIYLCQQNLGNLACIFLDDYQYIIYT